MDEKNSKIIFHSFMSAERKLAHPGIFKKSGEISYTEKFVERARQKRLQHQSNIIQNQFKISKPMIANGTRSVVNKEIDNIWGFEKPAGKLPSPEQRLESDKAYSKIILGE